MCYDKCPKRTRVEYEYKICIDFFCVNYYNYTQDGCIDEIPEGYYCNDRNLKTIDKCHETCKTCLQGPTIDKANCLICNEDFPFFYFGNCLKHVKMILKMIQEF